MESEDKNPNPAKVPTEQRQGLHPDAANLEGKLVNELGELLGKMEVDETWGDRRSGENWKVEAAPLLEPETAGKFKVRLHVSPNSEEACRIVSTPADLIRGDGEVASTFDHPNRFGDRWSGPVDFGKYTFSARHAKGGQKVVPFKFKRATEDKFREQVYAKASAAAASEAEFADRAYGSAAAAAGAESAAATEEEEKRTFSHEEDGLRVEADIVRTRNGGARLEFYSDVRKLRGAGIVYQIGDEAGAAKFGARPEEGLFVCKVDLEMPYDDAVRCEPTFEIYLIDES